MPRDIVEPYLKTGTLVAKKTTSSRQKDVGYLGWNNCSEGVASRWWRVIILESELIIFMYQYEKS